MCNVLGKPCSVESLKSHSGMFSFLIASLVWKALSYLCLSQGFLLPFPFKAKELGSLDALS